MAGMTRIEYIANPGSPTATQLRIAALAKMMTVDSPL